MTKLRILYETLVSEQPKELIQLNVKTKKQENYVLVDLNIKMDINHNLYLDHNHYIYSIPKDTTTLHLHFLGDDDSIEYINMYHINPDILSVDFFLEHEDEIMEKDPEFAISFRSFLEESNWCIQFFEYVIWFQGDDGTFIFLSFESYDVVINTNFHKVFYLKDNVLTESCFTTYSKNLFDFSMNLN